MLGWQLRYKPKFAAYQATIVFYGNYRTFTRLLHVKKLAFAQCKNKKKQTEPALTALRTNRQNTNCVYWKGRLIKACLKENNDLALITESGKKFQRVATETKKEFWKVTVWAKGTSVMLRVRMGVGGEIMELLTKYDDTRAVFVFFVWKSMVPSPICWANSHRSQTTSL